MTDLPPTPDYETDLDLDAASLRIITAIYWVLDAAHRDDERPTVTYRINITTQHGPAEIDVTMRRKRRGA